MLNQNAVALVYDPSATGYQNIPPYNPHRGYPEYPFRGISPVANWGYDLVRRVLREMGLDAEHYDSMRWNPLRKYIKPGNVVVLKPNLVSHVNWGRGIGLTDTSSLITHGSIIRAVADYVAIALDGIGEIIVADSPVLATDWDAVSKLAGLYDIQDFYTKRGIAFETIDLRLTLSEEFLGVTLERKAPKNIDDYVEIDLADKSLLMPIISDWKRFSVSSYGSDRMRAAHNPFKNAYLIPKLILNADCFINLPKLKSHQKAGITCSLKNLVGINGHKDYLPHYRIGGERSEGDEFPNLHLIQSAYWRLIHTEWETEGKYRKLLCSLITRVMGKLLPQEVVRQGQGGWCGNDTLWRTILDINRAFFFFDVHSNQLSETPQRNYFSIIDGIVGGEKESPLSPSPKTCGSVIAGENPVATDVVAASLMGFRVEEIKQLNNAFGICHYPLTNFSLADVVVAINGEWIKFEEFYKHGIKLGFEPSAGWKNRVEYQK